MISKFIAAGNKVEIQMVDSEYDKKREEPNPTYYTRVHDVISEDQLELVMTGRNPSPQLLALADYVTEMKKVRHPYDRGIGARNGIER